MSIPLRKKDPKENDKGMQRIMERASKKKEIEGGTIQLMDSFLFRNANHIAFWSIEVFHNCFFHAFDTLKVRVQAKNKFEDVSHFQKNLVIQKRTLSIVYNSFQL